jgi:hypothetical protein
MSAAKKPAAPRRLDAAWHRGHPMPKHPTLEERLAWHVAHAKRCACRPMPASVAAELEARRHRTSQRAKSHTLRASRAK